MLHSESHISKAEFCLRRLSCTMAGKAYGEVYMRHLRSTFSKPASGHVNELETKCPFIDNICDNLGFKRLDCRLLGLELLH